MTDPTSGNAAAQPHAGLTRDPPSAADRSHAGWVTKWSKWMSDQIRPSGEIRDPYSDNPLTFQYHYSAVILGRLCNPHFPENDSTTDRVWHYFLAIPRADAAPAFEFNVFLFALAHYAAADRGANLADAIAEYLDTLSPPSIDRLASRNRNFAYMLRFVLDYAATNLDIDRYDGYRHDLDVLLDGCHAQDDLFVDTKAPSGGGYASSVYVAKIALTNLLGGSINDKERQFADGRRAVDALLSLADTSRVFAYGRSQLSLFGYANLYTCARILAHETGGASYVRCVATIESLLASWQLESGELALNPARCNRTRPGFDQYMHAIVYNAYAWSLCLFSDLLAPRVNCDETIEFPNAPANPNVREYRDSGLIRVESDTFDLLLSVRRFNDEPKLKYDPRYQPFAPQLIRTEGRDVVPPIPRDIGGFMRLAVRRTWYERLRSFASAIRFVLSDACYDDFLDRSGFMPYIALGSHVKVCAGTQRDLQSHATPQGCEVRSTFDLDAVVSRRKPWRKFAARSHRAKSHGELRTTILTGERSIAFEHELRLSDRVARNARCVHLNLRLPSEPLSRHTTENAMIFEISPGIVLRHEPHTARVESTRCMGATGEVVYVRASEPIRAGESRHIRTTMTFEGTASH